MAADPRIKAPFAAAGAPLDELVWVPCPTCWGQRQLWCARGGVLAHETCPECYGIGGRLVPA